MAKKSKAQSAKKLSEAIVKGMQEKKAQDVVVMDRAEVRRTKRGLFGFVLPSLNLFGGGDDDPDEVRELDAKVAGAAPSGVGFYSLILDDKSQWVTTERLTGFAPKPGDRIVIKKGSFGYRAKWKFAIIPVRRTR